MSKAVTYRNLASYLGLAVVTALVLFIALKLPLSRLDVPYTFDGDDVDKLTQVETVAESGWLFHNDRLGYPFGYDRLDFPRFDSLNYAVMGPIAALSGAPGLAINLYYILGFFLVAFAAFYAFGRLGFRTGVACVCALAYAFLPYHVLRGISHVTNGAYFLVPLAMLVLVWLARGLIEMHTRDGRRRFVFALVIALLLPLQTPYNGVFFAMLCLVAGAIAVAGDMRWRAALPALAVIVAVGAAFLVELAPVLVHRLSAGEPAFVAARMPFEADAYALRLNQVLLPTTRSRIAPLALSKRAFDHAMEMDTPYTEVSNQYLGAFGVFGFLVLCWTLARSVAARGPPGAAAVDEAGTAVRIGAVLAIAILVLALPSGVCSLIAYWITAKIRAYNRILPFLAFPCILAAGWALQSVVRRIRARWVACAFLVVVALVAMWDLLVRPPFIRHVAAAAAYDRDHAYFAGVERRLGEGAAVFQLPAVWYPEYPQVYRMTDYSGFKPYLMTKSLRFSYGAAHGRMGYAWSKYVEKQPPAALIAHAHAMGFAAILIDGYAYADDAALAAAADPLKRTLPQAPLVSDDGRWWLFPLDGCCGAPVPRIAPGAAPKVFAYATDGPPLRFGEAGAGRLYGAAGWWDPEDWGMWSDGGAARLRMLLQPAPSGAVVLTLATQMLVSEKVPQRRLRIECNGRLIGEAVYTEANPVQTLAFEIPPGLVKDDGLMELEFVTTPRTTPYWAGVTDDDRELGVGIAELSIAPADGSPHGS